MPILEPEFMALTRDLDVAAFWEENQRCRSFTPDKPRCAASFSPDDHWLLEFLGVESTLRYYREKPYRDECHRQANAVLREHVGYAPFSEDTWEAKPKRIENLFGCEFEYHEGGTPWFKPVTEDPAEFARVLDRAEQTEVAAWALPDEYRREWAERESAGRELARMGGAGRGPATVMTSVIAPETLLFWVFDHPELVARFRDVLMVKMVELNQVLREFSGNTQPGFAWFDDNCALFNREMYREYCYPVLERVMAELAPGDSRRFQHSDSDMAHLIADQYALGIREVNYGPNIDAALIREKMPAAMIHGHLPPFLLRNGSPDEIRQRIRGDFEKAGATGGLLVTTAGSLAGGTGVGRMRWFMQCVQDCCRY